VNAQTNYYAAPQQVNAQGLLIGHSHIVIETLSSLQDTEPLDPNKFAFFKGLNIPADGNNILSANVTAGLPAGVYRMCSINTAANHQPALVSNAQHGALDDCSYFTIKAAGANSTASASATDSTSSSTDSATDTSTATSSGDAAQATDSASSSTDTATDSPTTTGSNDAAQATDFASSSTDPASDSSATPQATDSSSTEATDASASNESQSTSSDAPAPTQDGGNHGSSHH
jgi:hypothetical protein